MNLEIPKIEQQNVCNVYDNINKDSSQLLDIKYELVLKKFLNNFSLQSKILGVGCGNGKNMIDRPDNFVDVIFEGFVDMCIGKGLNVVQSDATNLLYEDNFFDVTISIAVIHHLSTIKRRKSNRRNVKGD